MAAACTANICIWEALLGRTGRCAPLPSRPNSCCTLACAAAAQLEKRHTCPTPCTHSHTQKNFCILICRFGDLSEKEPFNPSLRVHPSFLSLPCRFGDLSEKGELVERILQRCTNVTYYAS